MKILRLIKRPGLGNVSEIDFIGVPKMSKKRRAVYDKIAVEAIRAYRDQKKSTS